MRLHALLLPLLFLVLNPCSATTAPLDPLVRNVRDLGAKADRRTNDQEVFQAAIDSVSKSGGGTVLVPPGDYLCGAIRLASNVTLRLEAGATIYVSTDPKHYRSRYFLSAEGASNIALEGGGTIDGQATADYGERWGVPEKPLFRIGLLLFTGCKNIKVRGLTILNSDSWTLHFKRCDDIDITGVTIRNNYRRLNSDGIDPNSCQRVRIADCNITAGDDCIVLKSTEPFPCQDVTVTNCVLESAASALKLGTESQGDFRNIRFSDCRIRNSPTGIGFYLKDGATMENVSFSKITIDGNPNTFRDATPIYLDIERRHMDSKVGTIRDVLFEDIDITSGSGVLAQGMPESPLENITFRRIRIRVPEGHDYSNRKKPIGGNRTLRNQRDTEFARLESYFTVAHARGLTVDGLSVEIAGGAFRERPRSAFVGRFLENSKIGGIERQPSEPDSPPVIDLKDCREVDVSK